jgi:sugar O-acyltransferase (sialic acid O-acetyltransferase NeuD family)
MVEKILVVGAGGHSRTVLSILCYYKQFKVIGIADRDKRNIGEKILQSEIKYSWDDFKVIRKKGVRFAAVAVGDNKERKELSRKLVNAGFGLPVFVHPTAILEKDAVLGEGSVICMGAKISTQVNIGRGCIVYTGSILDHEAKAGDYVFIAPGCNIAGRVSIGSASFIGIGSSIKEKIRIGKGVTVGAGSVVLKNIPDGMAVAGIPAAKIR